MEDSKDLQAKNKDSKDDLRVINDHKEFSASYIARESPAATLPVCSLCFSLASEDATQADDEGGEESKKVSYDNFEVPVVIPISMTQFPSCVAYMTHKMKQGEF
jgi:hypothetical protein